MEFTLDFLRLFTLGLFYVSPILSVLVLIIILMGLVVGKREGWSRADAVYYAFITATTVGYGDFHPRKKLSKHLAIGIALVGLILTGIVVAVGLHAATKAFEKTYADNKIIEQIKAQ
jgi:voltage-gated potassium channel